MARAATLALAFLALAAAANAEVVTKILMNPNNGFTTKVKIDFCITLINGLGSAGIPQFANGFNGLKGTGFCPNDAAIRSFVGSLGCRGTCSRDVAALASWLTTNAQIIPYITRIMLYHQLAPSYGLVFGSEFNFWQGGVGGGTSYKTKLVRDPSQTPQTLEIGLTNPNQLRVRGASTLASPHTTANTATTTFLNAAINQDNTTIPATPLAVIHAINRVLLPFDFYFTPVQFFASCNDRRNIAYYNATFRNFYNRAVSENSRTFNSTNPLVIFAAPDAAMVDPLPTSNTAVTAAKIRNSRNLRGALIRYASAPFLNGTLSYSGLLPIVAPSKTVLSLLVLPGANANSPTFFDIKVVAGALAVNGTANTVNLVVNPVTIFAGASTVFWSNVGPLVPVNTGVA